MASGRSSGLGALPAGPVPSGRGVGSRGGVVGFSVAVERITAGDDEIAAALLDAELPALLPALAHATGDLSLLRDELRPDPLLINEPQAGFTPEQQDAIRAVALGALVRFRDGGCVLAPAADHRRRCSASWSSPSAGRRWTPTCRSSRRSWPSAVRITARRAGTRAHWLPTSSSAWRSSAPACPACWPPTGCSRRACRSWCSRRTTTSAARGGRTPIRGAGWTTRTTSTATPSPRSTTGRSTSRPRARCSTTSPRVPTSSTCAATSASGPR